MKKLFFGAALLLTACATNHSESKLTLEHDILSLHKQLKAGAISSEELLNRSLVAAETYKSHNALIYIDQASATAAAKRADVLYQKGEANSPLQGIAIVVKDNIHIAGMPNSAGTAALKNFVPKQSNAVVNKLQDAGAIMLAKTNMHELAFGITSNNAEFGAVKNAIDSRVIAGGSSGGTAVAVATGVVRAGLGTDTGGSTRIPSVLNGIAGFRPTLGRYDSTAVTPLSSTRDTIGPMAKTVAEVALLDAVITGESTNIQPASLQGLRVGVPTNYFYENIDAEVLSVTEKVLEKLKKAGVELIEVEMPNISQLNHNVSFPLVFYEVMNELPNYLQEYDTGVSWSQLINGLKSPDVVGVFKALSGELAVPDSAYQQVLTEFRPKLQSLYRDVFADYEIAALIAPATPISAAPVAEDGTLELNGKRVPAFNTYIQNTDPSSNAGIPSLVLPAGKSRQGLPIGLMLDGAEGSDRLLLEVGLAIENLLR